MSGGGSPAIDLATMGASQWVGLLSDRGILTTNTSLVICSWNHWLETHTGIPANQAVGRRLFEVCPSMLERGIDRYYAAALLGEGRILSEMFHKYLIPITRNKQVSGTPEMSQSARIVPIRDEAAIVGTITVIDDVTDRVIRERELRSQITALDHARKLAEESSRLKDEFLATLSHEIRTPLNAVLGWTRILRSQQEVKSRQHALEVIERNAQAQLRLIEDLLDTARVISGKLRLDVQTVRLEDIVQAAIEVLKPAADAKGITIKTTFDADAPSVNGDGDRLRQVAWNLISNSVKFTGRNGRIEIETFPTGKSEVILRVGDTGEGISPEFLPHVFDRFRQADASSSRRHGGLGLGLGLARQIVELHGGVIAAESAGVGKGATFLVTLPGSPYRTPAVSDSASKISIDLQGITVLLVEDDEDGREMLVRVLEDLGARVRAVASASEALTEVGARGFAADVLLSDLGLPGMDGIELIRKIRSLPSARARKLPAIAVTAYANPEDRLNALKAGYQAHLSKPIDGLALAESIRQVRRRPLKAAPESLRRA